MAGHQYPRPVLLSAADYADLQNMTAAGGPNTGRPIHSDDLYQAIGCVPLQRNTAARHHNRIPEFPNYNERMFWWIVDPNPGR